MFPLARTTLAAALSLPVLVFAQAAGPAVPAATCVKPAIPATTAPLKKAAADKLNAESTAYAACASSYIKGLRATADAHQAIADQHTAASNTYAAEFNAFGAALTAYSKAQAAAAAAAD